MFKALSTLVYDTAMLCFIFSLRNKLLGPPFRPFMSTSYPNIGLYNLVSPVVNTSYNAGSMTLPLTIASKSS